MGVHENITKVFEVGDIAEFFLKQVINIEVAWNLVGTKFFRSKDIQMQFC